MFEVFAFGFETRNKTISSLIYRLINEGEWCIGLLLWCLAALNLLSYICQAAGDFHFPVHHACTRAPRCCDTRPRT